MSARALRRALLFLFIAGLCVTQNNVSTVRGFRDVVAQTEWEQLFQSVPDTALAREHLRILTSAPHVASTPEDRKTAEYVAKKYREAGLETQIVEYKVWLGMPVEISVNAIAPAHVKMHGPTREHVEGDPFQNDPRVLTAFNAYSPSGDVQADIVYANYGRPEDIATLKKMGVDVRGKILMVRYGANYRGVKTYVAEQNGAKGVIIFSDPIDDGWFKGGKYPVGPWRPDTAVQRGSVNYIFQFPGDPTTPGVASVPTLPDAQRIDPSKSASMPRVPTVPLSYKDARPLLEHLRGPESPREWQGGLPFTYHVGPGPVRVKMHVKMDYAFRRIWNVIGVVRGSEQPDQWVIAGNHRDAWAYGAVDPNSGTTVQLEAVHGIGRLLKAGWRPKRTIVFASWDAEEHGLIGSTEWAEAHGKELRNAVAYFNTDSGCSGPNFGASAVPSLRRFIREITKSVPSPQGGTVYDAWLAAARERAEGAKARMPDMSVASPQLKLVAKQDVPIGNLGSGSDYTAFFQHFGVPSSDVNSSGAYGVYHSVFDNFAWYMKFGDPTFVYTQQMARIYGLQVIRMASADVLPFNYKEYGDEIVRHAEQAQLKADRVFGAGKLDLAPIQDAARRFARAGEQLLGYQFQVPARTEALNSALIRAERALLTDSGLPNRSWYKHSIYAPGEYSGYAAVPLPGVNEAIDERDLTRAQDQASQIAAAVNRAAGILESYK